VTQQNAAMVEQATAASHSLAGEAAELARLVGQFQIGQVASPSHATSPPPRKPATALPAPRSRVQGNAQILKLKQPAHTLTTSGSENWDDF